MLGSKIAVEAPKTTPAASATAAKTGDFGIVTALFFIAIAGSASVYLAKKRG